jgi:dipeptidase
MKNILLFTLILLAYGRLSLLAQDAEFAAPVSTPESCTSIMVGKKASTDGSVMTSHTCDGNYRTWMNIAPACTYDKDTVAPIYENRLHTEFVADETRTKFKGDIPQAKSTYRFLNTAYPCMNEKQLAIGETTITGRKDLVNPDGMFMIEELERIALQRCSTARDAIRLMGELIREYGYADWGECLTVADRKEVWHFEVFGEGKDKVGGVWAAIRIPDDHVGVSANIPRISNINVKDTENCMASDNVFDAARRLGYWDGKQPFCFWKVYGGGSKAFAIREYFIMNSLAPSLNLSYDAEELPFSVKPEKKVSVSDVLSFFRQTYEGSQWDITKNLKGASANPWMTTDMVNMLNGIKDSTVVRYRLVAVPQCSYAHVIQLRDWLPDGVGGVAWVSLDNPGQSPRFPIFCGVTSLPECFNICGQLRYRTDAAIWTYRSTNKLATVRWGDTKAYIQGGIAHFEDKGLRELPFVEAQYGDILRKEGKEKADAYLSGYTSDFIGATMLKWKELGEQFWKTFARGF